MPQYFHRLALIIGAMKCGTTSLYEYMAQHPKIAAAPQKELGFFSSPLRWANGLDWYKEQFHFDPARHVWALEASTNYTKRPLVDGVVGRLGQVEDVELRFIYVVRDPCRRIESHARWIAINKEAREAGDARTNWSLDGGISEHMLNFSRYAYQLEPYETKFGRDHIFVATSEELNSNPQGLMSRIFDFLDLPPHEIAVDQKFNVGQGLRRAPEWWDLARKNAILQSIYHNSLPGWVRSSLWQKFSISQRTFGRFQLTEEEEADIQRELRGDLQMLAHNYGIDLRENVKRASNRRNLDR